MLRNIRETLAKGEMLVLVSITDQQGSTPRGAGARMLASAHGSLAGTVGGGITEGSAIAFARSMLRAAESGAAQPDAVMRFALDGSMDMLCGGALTFLLELVRPGSDKASVLERAAALAEAGEAFVRLTEICPCPGTDGARRTRSVLFRPESDGAGDDVPPDLLPVAVEALARRSPPHVRELAGAQWFVEPFVPQPGLYVFGAGHVGAETAVLAARVGFRTVVVDDRPEFADADRFPACRVIVPPDLGEEAVTALLERENPGPGDAVVIVTRGHAHDRDVLAAALRGRAGYLGMIGSRAKRAGVYGALRECGVSASALEAVHSPVGLRIGAETPEEIAVSIVAELIQWRRQK